MTPSNLKEPEEPERAGHLNSARTRVARMRAALLAPTPEAIERCLPGLAEAADLLGRVQQDLAAGGERHNVLMDLHALKRELGAIHQLIARGAGLYRGWSKLLGAATAGYMPSGEAAAVAPSGKVSIRG